MTTRFPQETVTVTYRGFPWIGRFIREDEDGMFALYDFPGDFIIGSGKELWLSEDEAKDKQHIELSL